MNTSFISTQQIKDLINEQKFTSTQEIMNCMKNMFADILEQTLQAEMDQHLGYEHAERRNDDAKKNYRNGSVKRTMKTQLGEVEVNVPRDRNGEFEPKIIYTTNAIEGLNRQFRKVTKTKNVFPNDDSLRKMLYLAIQNLSSRWTQRCRNWDLIINQLRIMDSSEG